MLNTNSPCVCVIKVCSNGSATFIIGEIIAKLAVNGDFDPKMLNIKGVFTQTGSFQMHLKIHYTKSEA